jgi:hypothetical protein
MANFDNYVTNPALEYPQKLGVSLSAADNSVIYIPSATPIYKNAETKNIAGILYNTVVGVGSATTTLTMVTGASGAQVKVHPAYNGQTFALYFTDGSTTKFTVLTGTTNQVLTAGVTFDDRGPEERRHFAVEI